MPQDIDRWNWGAFLLNWIWGIGNNTFIAFLMFVPFVNIAVPFILGATGSASAWRNKRWESVEAFRATQRKWALAGLAALVLVMVLLVGMFVAILASLKSSQTYQMTVKTLNADAEAKQVLGQPISTGIPTGSVRVSGPDGEASLSFSAEGPKGDGTVYVEATRSLGQWKLDEAVLEESKSGQRIDLAD